MVGLWTLQPFGLSLLTFRAIWSRSRQDRPPNSKLLEEKGLREKYFHIFHLRTYLWNSTITLRSLVLTDFKKIHSGWWTSQAKGKQSGDLQKVVFPPKFPSPKKTKIARWISNHVEVESIEPLPNNYNFSSPFHTSIIKLLTRPRKGFQQSSPLKPKFHTVIDCSALKNSKFERNIAR